MYIPTQRGERERAERGKREKEKERGKKEIIATGKHHKKHK